MVCRLCLLLCVGVPIAACATPDTIGEDTHRPYDKDFDKLSLSWAGTFKGAATDIYIKRLQNGKNLQICGFYIGSTGMQEDLTAKWLAQAKITLSGEEIVSTSFLPPVSSLRNAIATCVITTTPYRPGMINEKMRIRGGNVRGSY